ncbi:twin-arginine translocation signal domain-containing protein [Haloarcula sp. S1AR25-5A]|uniref:Twin-arginine translocation signal domain-containing protein n=1 Tax=Haloarcula terrestris TaxID=2950533 RepID=A0AAE4JFQ4_9EURY|nr:twin-arginine translocation signal domain-containing protein [Haloarcula terrestris]MDS0220593.1 twin-arginine translocation signal domain-containing protein [Haloarcula terrestris]
MKLTQSMTSDDSPASTPSSRRRFLKGTLGAAATAAAVPSLSGVAAAHFPTELSIDIQPENAENFIDLGDHDTVAVAVQQSEFVNSDGDSETFDPTERAIRYRFGSRLALEDGEGARPVDDGEVRQPEDSGEDSHESLVLQFPVEETGLDGGEETAWLYWERDESGDHGYAGFDSVRVYGGDPSGRTLIEQLQQVLESDTANGTGSD